MTALSATTPALGSKRNFNNIRRKYFSYLLPAVIMEIAVSLNEFVDSLVVANLLDAKALSIVSVAGPILFIYSTLFVLFGDGGSTLYSIHKGNHDNNEAGAMFAVSMIATALAGILLTVLGLLFTPQVAGLLGGSLDFGDEFIVYLRYTFLAALPLMLSSAFVSFLPAAGHPVLASVVCIVSNVVNLLGDFIFIQLLGMGVEGAALATLAGFTVGLLIVLVFYVTKGRNIGSLKVPGKFFPRLGIICTTGAAEASGQTGYAIKYAFCNSIAAIYAGQTGVVAFSVCMQIMSIISIFVSAFYATMTPFLGTLVGLNDRSGSRKVISFTNRLQILCGVVLFVLFELWPELLTTMYAVEAGPMTDTVIVAIRIFAPILLIRWVYLQFRSVATILGFKLYAFLIGVVDAFVFLIPLGTLFCALMGINGLWLAYVLSSVIILIGIFFINRGIAARSGGKYKGFWLITDDRNVVADLTFRADPEDIGHITKEIEKVCREHGMPMSRAMLASVSVEEMVVITARSVSSTEAIPMDILIQKGEEAITIDLVSIGSPFNPTNYQEGGELDNFEMLRRLSKSVTYDYVLGMNTTRIIITV